MKMNAYTMPGIAEMGMVWVEQNPSSQDLSMGTSCSESGDMILDQDSPYFMSSHNSISNQSLDDDISNMTMAGMDFLPYSDKQDSSDGSYMDDDTSSVFMITTSTQTTASCPTRKIRPIKHPGLVLKTPIAYQGNTDPSVIPIQKDGIAICEKCGAIGVKHAFYTKERRFCSMTCARSYNGLLAESLSQHQDLVQEILPQPPEGSPEVRQFMSHRFKMELEDDYTGLVLDQPFPQISQPPSMMHHEPQPVETVSNRRRPEPEAPEPYEWDPLLKDPNFVAASVTCFKHAPLSDIWDNIIVGMKVEVENTDCGDDSEAISDSFWVATVISIVGYKALLRYEGFGSDDSKDFWVSVCSNQIHSVGWCATRGKPLIPPKSIRDRHSDWKAFLCKRLTGAHTLPSNFSNKVAESMKSRFQCGLNLEVIDKDRISQVKLATIHKIVGKRINIKYFDFKADPYGFWCHEDSPLIHPVGWAKKVGHNIVAPSDYLMRINAGIHHENDARFDLFLPIQIGSPGDSETNGFDVGLKLEAIDPLNLSSICAATIMKVLHCGYIMIRIDTYEVDATGADWFCYHVKSPCIFPVGFCKENDIQLTPPYGYAFKYFTWEKFLQDTNDRPLTKSLLSHSIPPYGFSEGMKLESADLMDPRLVCAATIYRIVAHLIKIQFDGWDHDFDQWLDLDNCNIYPVGWAHSVNYILAGPSSNSVLTTSSLTTTVKHQKIPKKRGRKKKKDCSPSKPKVSDTESQVPIKNEVIEEKQDLIEPEICLEPVALEQSMPVSMDPPPERKATSYINSHENASTKIIPILIDNDSDLMEGKICPEEWNVFDVAQFLRVNDCLKYCDIFCMNKIDGKTFLALTNPEVLKFTSGKVGPSVKIFNLIQQLKERTNPTKSRLRSKSKKKIL